MSADSIPPLPSEFMGRAEMARPYPLESSLADLRQRLGGISPERILLYPWPGLASERDVLRIRAETGRLCELVDGVLVEKPMGFFESVLAVAIARAIGNYLERHPLGVVAGADGMLRVHGDQIRIADVSFIRWERLPPGAPPVPAVAPDLAVEVLSEGNTQEEIRRKLADFFEGGTRLVWVVDPGERTAQVHKPEGEMILVDEAGVLRGGDVLPGFELALRDLFQQLEQVQRKAD